MLALRLLSRPVASQPLPGPGGCVTCQLSACPAKVPYALAQPSPGVPLQTCRQCPGPLTGHTTVKRCEKECQSKQWQPTCLLSAICPRNCHESCAFPLRSPCDSVQHRHGPHNWRRLLTCLALYLPCHIPRLPNKGERHDRLCSVRPQGHTWLRAPRGALRYGRLVSHEFVVEGPQVHPLHKCGLCGQPCLVHGPGEHPLVDGWHRDRQRCRRRQVRGRLV